MNRSLIFGWVFAGTIGGLAWALDQPWTLWEANVVALLAALLCATTTTTGGPRG